MGIALKNGTVHECARVTFVGVTYNVLLVGCILSGEAPLKTCGESSASTASESGILNDLDNLIGRKFGQALCKSLIAVHSDIFFNIFRVNNTTVTKRNSVLLLVEIGFIQRLDIILMNCLFIEKSLDHTALEKMLLDDFGNVLDLNLAVETALGIYDHDRT